MSKVLPKDSQTPDHCNIQKQKRIGNFLLYSYVILELLFDYNMLSLQENIFGAWGYGTNARDQNIH